jgi:hypothetical protein
MTTFIRSSELACSFIVHNTVTSLREGLRLVQKLTHCHPHRSTLDPLLERLARDFINDADLSARLQGLFRVGTTLGSMRIYELSHWHVIYWQSGVL